MSGCQSRSVKLIRLELINKKAAKAAVQRWHYSRKMPNNTQLCFGAFMQGRMLGVITLGPGIAKRKSLALVTGTPWNAGFYEIGRLAFSDDLPRNSESRMLSVLAKWLRTHSKQTEWLLSYADACQCGDGAIYRAAGFDLIGIRKNTTLLLMPSGMVVADKTFNNNNILKAGHFKRMGANALPGFQLRYVLFLNMEAKNRLTVPILPYSVIREAGAEMYKGKRPKQATGGDQPSCGGAAPTRTLQESKDATPT